jgi:hypothetical protein
MPAAKADFHRAADLYLRQGTAEGYRQVLAEIQRL